MIRKVYLMVLLLVASMATAYGDEQKDVKLNTDDKQAMVELSYCNIFLEIENVDQYGKVTVSVAMENTGETNELLLFDRGYDESTLKEMQIFNQHEFSRCVTVWMKLAKCSVG